MDSTQRNGGTAGIITAACLLLLVILFLSAGFDNQTAQDPAKALPLLRQNGGAFAGIGVLGLLAAGFGLVFTIGLFARLRGGAPTRAAALLSVAFVGLTVHAIGAAILWQGGQFLVAVASKDQPAAANAWIATAAVLQGLNAMANAFTGASILLAGWAILDTHAMGTALGWVAVIAGIVEILQTFSVAAPLVILGFLLTIVWLAWGGSTLRRPAI